MSSIKPSRRSGTGNHVLLPASRPTSTYEHVPRVPTYSLITWTFGRGSAIWRIWPTILLHTAFAGVVVTLCMREIVHLEIPSVMLTVLGVVIGFVISYRAMSGYERYWLGRGYWSDIMRNSRTLGRLIWYQVPPRLSPKTPEEAKSGKVQRSVKEMSKVMAEKRMALDMIHGFSVALKHHLRGELGIYFEDLYHLVRPLHDHEHTADDDTTQRAMSLPIPRKGMRITTQTTLQSDLGETTSIAVAAVSSPPKFDREATAVSHSQYATATDLPASQYGTFRDEEYNGPGIRSPSRASSTASSGPSQPLLPSVQPPANADEVMGKVSSDLIPFARTWGILKGWLGFGSKSPELPTTTANSNGTQEVEQGETNDPFRVTRKWGGPVQSSQHFKHRPKVAGGGENLPLEIVRCLSEWISVLDDRGTVSGPALGNMIGALGAFEDSLTGLERILTTPLPFVYAVHIRHTVWLYLFFLPFQLVSTAGYYTIPAVAMASFIYLGFVAAGEEIEQPFGYDDNDLDLDLFCQEVIGNDIKHLKQSPALNVYLGPLQDHPQTVHRRSMTLNEITHDVDHDDLVTPI